jgi:hypothetical protein
MRRWAHWRDAPRWLRRAVLGVVGFLVLVPVVTNAVLWLRVVPRLMNADSAAFSYRFAWSPWPTRIKVYHLTVTGQDPNVQFAVGVEEAWLTLELWAAASERTIRITRLRGSGVSVRALQRLQPWALDAAKIKALPDIPGRTKPPVTFAHVPPPPATREHYDMVSIDVRDIDATAKEVWIDEARLRGNLHVTGAFLFRPGLELHIGPHAAVDLHDAVLGIAGVQVLTKLEGRATCQTPYFNPVEPEGIAILRFFSGSLAVHATLVNAEFANYFLAPAGVEVHGGAGRLALQFSFDRGRGRPGSKLELTSRGLQSTVASTRIDTSLTIGGDIDASGRGALHLTTTHLSLGPRNVKARLSGGELSARVTTTTPVDLADPEATLTYAGTLTPLSGDVAAVVPYLPKSFPLTLDAGELSVGGAMSGTVGRPDLQASGRLQLELASHAEERRFTGKVDLRGRLAESAERLELTGSKVGVSDVMVAKGKDVTYGWWTHVEIMGGGLSKDPSPALALDLTGRLRDIEPLFVAFGKELGVPDWIQGLLPLPNTGWHGHLAAEGGAVRVRDFRATSGSVEVLLKLKKPADDAPSGALKLASGGLSYGVAFSPDQTKTELFATQRWFDQQL